MQHAGGLDGAPAQPPGLRQPLLLGVTDDVDCAVVQLSTAAEPDGSQQAASVAEQGTGADDVPLVLVRHVSSIPALAYVAAGKTHKRHLLLGPGALAAADGAGATDGSGSALQQPRRPLAAVLVEDRRFAYIYEAVHGAGAQYGRQQVRHGTCVPAYALWYGIPSGLCGTCV